MSTLLLLFSNNILPIFIAAGIGLLMGKYLDIQPQTLSKVVFYAFSPCLVFILLTHSELENSALVQMAIYTLLFTLILGAIAWAIGKLFKLERKLLASLVLVSMFANSGNYGLSLNKFAFGDEALAYASVYFVISGILVYSLGIVIASLGQTGLKESLARTFKYPTIYAILLAVLFNVFGWSLPLPIDRAVTVLADAAIPTMLILLGLQLQRSKLPKEIGLLGTANILKLVVSPIVAFGLTALLGLSGPAWQAGIAESSMPTAVMVTVLATEFDISPSFATAAVTTTTLLSPLTLTPLLALLGG